MSSQPSLFPLASETAQGLVCAFGSVWTGPRGCGPCVACQNEADRLEAAFWAKVDTGVFDPRGYPVKRIKAVA